MGQVKRILWKSTRAYAVCLPIFIGAIHGVNLSEHGNAMASIASFVLGVSAAYLVRRLWGVVFPIVEVDDAGHGAPA